MVKLVPVACEWFRKQKFWKFTDTASVDFSVKHALNFAVAHWNKKITWIWGNNNSIKKWALFASCQRLRKLLLIRTYLNKFYWNTLLKGGFFELIFQGGLVCVILRYFVNSNIFCTVPIILVWRNGHFLQVTKKHENT